MAAAGTLYYGDNLDILRRYVADASVDLVYLDPPFNSKRDYNVLFREKSGEASPAQIEAFTDTWAWDRSAEKTFDDLVHTGPGAVGDAAVAIRQLLGKSDLTAYLVMMAARLVELHRVLKPTGTIWLHCDPTASHYLKVLLDAIFGPERFLNEVVWKRSSAHSDTRQGMRRAGKIHDILLAYTKTADYVWNPVYTPYDEAYLDAEYRHRAPDGRRYKETDLTAAKPGGDTNYEWRVKRRSGSGDRWQADLDDEHATPRDGWEYRGLRPYQGRSWAFSKANLVQFARDGRLVHRETGMPRQMQFADDMPGVSLQDVWDDIAPAMGNESLGYPTQKPLALLERIVATSTNPGDVVLDPFCGCGTAVVAAQSLGRRWLGIDITHLAIHLMRNRLNDHFPGIEFDVVGEPRDEGSARALAEQSRYQFQWWALSLVGARPAEGREKKGADRGIDGVIAFVDDLGGKPKRCLVQVKSGGATSATIRDLRGTMDREGAPLGLLVTMDDPSRAMRQEVAEAGHYHSDGWNRDFPRIQIRTIAELLSGNKPDLPPSRRTFQQAERVKPKGPVQPTLIDA